VLDKISDELPSYCLTHVLSGICEINCQDRSVDSYHAVAPRSARGNSQWVLTFWSNKTPIALLGLHASDNAPVGGFMSGASPDFDSWHQLIVNQSFALRISVPIIHRRRVLSGQ